MVCVCVYRCVCACTHTQVYYCAQVVQSSHHLVRLCFHCLSHLILLENVFLGHGENVCLSSIQREIGWTIVQVCFPLKTQRKDHQQTINKQINK